MVKWVIVLSLLFAAGTVFAQQCDERRNHSGDTSRYFINNNGTITDIESGLTWMRCSAGQRWDGNDCAGNPQAMTWHEAKQLAQKLNQSGSDAPRWRLPRLNELAGIVDIRCKNPRINLTLFPHTASDTFWTLNSTPGAAESAYILDFGARGVGTSEKSEKHLFRLVQGRE